MHDLLIASQNKGKIREISELLEYFNLNIKSTEGLDINEPEEDGSTFDENALIKAKYYAKKTGLISLADDSGLCIDALNGQPGIFSARWAENNDFNTAIKTIENMLEDTNVNDYTAYFVCSLAIYDPKTEQQQIFRGEIHGTLTFPARGNKGFGYDPIFIPAGHEHTFAEISPSEKKQISHRARAFDLFIQKQKFFN